MMKGLRLRWNQLLFCCGLEAFAEAWRWSQPLAEERVRVALSVRNVVFLPFYYAKDTEDL